MKLHVCFPVFYMYTLLINLFLLSGALVYSWNSFGMMSDEDDGYSTEHGGMVSDVENSYQSELDRRPFVVRKKLAYASEEGYSTQSDYPVTSSEYPASDEGSVSKLGAGFGRKSEKKTCGRYEFFKLLGEYRGRLPEYFGYPKCKRVIDLVIEREWEYCMEPILYFPEFDYFWGAEYEGAGTGQHPLEGELFIQSAASDLRMLALQARYKHTCEWRRLMTPLHLACRKGDLECVERILQSDTSQLYKEDSNGWNSFYWAVAGGELRVFEKLLEYEVSNGKRVNSDQASELLINLMFRLGRTSFIGLLIDKFGLKNDLLVKDIFELDDLGMCAVESMAGNGVNSLLSCVENCGMFREVIKEEKDVALIFNAAAEYGRINFLFNFMHATESFSYPLKKIDFDYRSQYGENALYTACKFSHKKEVIRLLLTKGDNHGNLLNPTDYGNNVFHAIFLNDKLKRKGRLEFIGALVEFIGDKNIVEWMLNAQNKKHCLDVFSVICGAAGRGRYAWHIVIPKKRFIDEGRGAFGGGYNIAGKYLALKSGFGLKPTEKTKELVMADLKLRCVKEDMPDATPLHLSVFGGNIELVEFLINHGADPNITDAFGSDALQLAIANEDYPMVDFIWNLEKYNKTEDAVHKALVVCRVRGDSEMEKKVRALAAAHADGIGVNNEKLISDVEAEKKEIEMMPSTWEK